MVSLRGLTNSPRVMYVVFLCLVILIALAVAKVFGPFREKFMSADDAAVQEQVRKRLSGQ